MQPRQGVPEKRALLSGHGSIIVPR